MVEIPTGKEDQLEAAVATVGPVVVAVDATANSFKVHLCSDIILSYDH